MPQAPKSGVQDGRNSELSLSGIFLKALEKVVEVTTLTFDDPSKDDEVSPSLLNVRLLIVVDVYQAAQVRSTHSSLQSVPLPQKTTQLVLTLFLATML